MPKYKVLQSVSQVQQLIHYTFEQRVFPPSCISQDSSYLQLTWMNNSHLRQKQRKSIIACRCLGCKVYKQKMVQNPEFIYGKLNKTEAKNVLALKLVLIGKYMLELRLYSWNIYFRIYSVSKWGKYIPYKFPGHILCQPENQVILFLTDIIIIMWIYNTWSFCWWC